VGGAEITKPDRSELNPHEPGDRVPDRGEQPPHDVVPPLMQPDLEERPTTDRVDDLDRVDLRGAVLERDPVLQPAPGCQGDRGADLREIRLADLEGRVHEPMRQLTVVREQQKALGIRIEATDVEQPLGPWNERSAGTSAIDSRPRSSDIVVTMPAGLLNTR